MWDEKPSPRKTSVVGVGEEVGEEDDSEVQHELEKVCECNLFKCSGRWRDPAHVKSAIKQRLSLSI